MAVTLNTKVCEGSKYVEEMWIGTLKTWMSEEQALNSWISDWIGLPHGHHYSTQAFFNSLSPIAKHLLNWRCSGSPQKWSLFISSLLCWVQPTQHRWMHLCHNLTHWRHLLIAVSSVISAFLYTVLYVAFTISYRRTFFPFVFLFSFNLTTV